MPNIEVRWLFEAYDTPLVSTATTYRIANMAGAGTAIVFSGVGFTYGAGAIPTGGAITSISLVVDNGGTDIVLQQLTNLTIDLGDVGDLMRDYTALRSQISWRGLIPADVDPAIATATQIRLLNSDGSFTDILGAGMDFTVPGSFLGNVTNLRHVANDGVTILANLNVSVSFNLAVAAILEEHASSMLFVLINQGNNFLFGVNNGVTIGANFYTTALEAGAGDDGINGGPIGSLDYEYATAGVIASLLTGTATGGGGNDNFSNIDSIQGSNFADTLTGNNAANRLAGRAGNDTLIGNGGNDVLEGREDDDVLNGGGGIDTATYDDDEIESGVTVSLLIAGAQNTGGAGVDTLISIENIDGSNLADTLTGAAGANILRGLAGADTLNGGDGNDTLEGGAGVDTMTGGLGQDSYFVDNAGDIVVEAPASGIDTVFTFLVNTTLALNTEILSMAVGSPFRGIGNDGANTLLGNDSDNILSGARGPDTLVGNGGNDRLIGGAQADQLTGGSGDDTFVFSSALGAINIDTITDFVAGPQGNGGEQIELDDAIFTALAPGSIQGHFWEGPSAGEASTRIIYNPATGALYYDPDGTGAAAQKQFAQLAANLDMIVDNFIVV